MEIDIVEALTNPPKQPNWLIPDFLHKGQVICIVGAAGVGKTILGYYLAICLANRTPFYNGKMISGTTLYFDEENSKPDAEQYLRWLWHGLKQPSPNLLKTSFFLELFSLAAPGERRWEYMKAKAEKIKPDLIVIDTATSVCGIQDENSNAEAAAAVTKLREVRAIAGENTSMIIFKHMLHTYDGTRTIRGAKAWLNMVDGVLFHVTKAGRPPQNGFRTTFVSPDKVRAFGLTKELKIIPTMVSKNGLSPFEDSLALSIT